MMWMKFHKELEILSGKNVNKGSTVFFLYLELVLLAWLNYGQWFGGVSKYPTYLMVLESKHLSEYFVLKDVICDLPSKWGTTFHRCRKQLDVYVRSSLPHKIKQEKDAVKIRKFVYKQNYLNKGTIHFYLIIFQPIFLQLLNKAQWYLTHDS
jgi:hypothetical protein